MAQATDFVLSNAVKCFIKSETTVGTANVAAMKQLQTTAITIPEISVPLEYGSNRSGAQVALSGQGHHVKGTNMYSFDTTMKGTDYAIKLACATTFNDAPGHAGTNTLNNTYAYDSASYKHGASNKNTYTVFFQNAGAATAAAKHMQFTGCVATGFSMSSGIGSESGELTVTINWVTAYIPSASTAVLSSTTSDSGNPKNHRDLDEELTNVDAEDVVVQGYEFSCSRSIERIHYQDNTNFHPFGYAMSGAWEVSGSLTCIRNTSIANMLAHFSDSGTIAINLSEATATNYSIALPFCYIGDTSMDLGGAVMTQTIPFTCVGNADLTSAAAMATIKTA